MNVFLHDFLNWYFNLFDLRNFNWDFDSLNFNLLHDLKDVFRLFVVDETSGMV